MTGLHVISQLRRMLRDELPVHPSERRQRLPRDFTGIELDFSEFHDLMHPWWSSYCASMPGGRRLHAKYWWEFKGEPAVLSQLCRFGWHLWTWHFQGDREWVACNLCLRSR